MKMLLFLFTFTLIFAACKKSETTVRQAPLGSNFNSCVIGKWSNSSLPLRLKMSSQFSGDYNDTHKVNNLNPLEQMAKAWNDAVPTKTLIEVPFPLAGTTGYSSTSSYKDGEIGIYKSPNWFANVSSNALAITQFYGVVTESAALGTYIQLTHGDIIVNYRDFGSELSMINAAGFDFDLPTIVLHEMGHLLGLCHEETEPSIMAPYYIATQHQIQQYDKNIIDYLYVGSSSGYSVKKNSNTNALSMPPGTEVSGMIELHVGGKCVHYLNGEKTFEHMVEKFKKKK
jgi:hypothetical protein